MNKPDILGIEQVEKINNEIAKIKNWLNYNHVSSITDLVDIFKDLDNNIIRSAYMEWKREVIDEINQDRI